MADIPPELAITDGISKFSIGNQHEPDRSNQASPRKTVTRSLVRSQKQYRDITTAFREAASCLQTGELIKDDYFTLFDAVGALEIMDSKMDSGHLEPGETLEDEYDTLRPILPDEVVAIMDSLLCLQVAWQTGYPLSQTIYASVYVENILWPEPKTLSQATFRGQSEESTWSPLHTALRVYCLLLIKTCDFVYRRISDETYYEEEDFFTQLYNRSLLTAFPAEDIIELADEVLQSLHKDDSIPEPLRNAIISRVKVQKFYLRATEHALESMPEAVKLAWTRLLEEISVVKDSHHLEKPVPEAISSKIQRKVASSNPPRPVVELEFLAAVDFITRLCKDGILVEDVADCSDLGSAVMFVQYFQAQFPQPTVYMRCQLQRLILRRFEYLGVASAAKLAQHDLCAELDRLVHPDSRLLVSANVTSPGLKSSIGIQQSKIDSCMERFAFMVNESFWVCIRALTMNRSRTRRMLCHTAIEWDQIQLELEDLDVEIRTHTQEKALEGQEEQLWEYPLSSWAYDFKLRQLILIHQLGFELEIYHKEELSSAYWSLQWICSVRHAHLERILTFVETKAAKLKRPTRAETESLGMSLMTIHYNIDFTITTAAMGEGLSALYRALSLVNLPSTQAIAPYSTDALRHSLRTRPFTHIMHPPLPSVAETETIRTTFIKQLISTARASSHTPARDSYAPAIEEALALLDHVDSMMKSTRKGWEKVSRVSPEIARSEICAEAWRADIKNHQKTAIAIGIASMGVRRWIENGAVQGAVDVEISMGRDAGLYHAFWVVPKIKVKSVNAAATGGKLNGDAKMKKPS